MQEWSDAIAKLGILNWPGGTAHLSNDRRSAVTIPAGSPINKRGGCGNRDVRAIAAASAAASGFMGEIAENGGAI